MATSKEKDHGHKDELEWIRFHEETLDLLDQQNQKQFSSSTKFFEKVKSNPLVPIGALCTVGALSYGLWSFRKGRPDMSQKMMRTRIAAQGFTIIAILGGLIMNSFTGKSSI